MRSACVFDFSGAADRQPSDLVTHNWKWRGAMFLDGKTVANGIVSA
jgi:hypothetical protein